MSSGRALTMTAIVPEYVGSAMRPSPAMTRDRSEGVVPHRPIHRRIGNQYSAANVKITRSVGSMGPSYCLGHTWNYATEMNNCESFTVGPPRLKGSKRCGRPD